MTPLVQNVYNVRIGRRKRYSKQTYNMAHIIQHEMLHVMAKNGLKNWGKREENEVSKDMNQFHMRYTL